MSERKITFETKIAERFAAWLSEKTKQPHIVSRGCDPPDFLLTPGTWLEVSDIYLSDEEAKFLNLPELRKFSFSGSPDEPALRLLSKLDEKLAKTSYRAIYQQRGQGILLLTCQYCLFDEVNLARVREGLDSFTPRSDQRFFSTVYFEYRLPAEERVYEVIYPLHVVNETHESAGDFRKPVGQWTS